MVWSCTPPLSQANPNFPDALACFPVPLAYFCHAQTQQQSYPVVLGLACGNVQESCSAGNKIGFPKQFMCSDL